MPKKKVQWKSGDLFGVPLPDGRYAMGQALGIMGDFVNVVNVALLDQRFTAPDSAPRPDPEKLFAVVSTTRDLLDNGRWVVVGHADLLVEKGKWPNEQFARKGYVGAETKGSAIISNFLAAYYGLFPWNGYKDPEYFEKLLISPSKRPPDTVLKMR